MTTEQAISVILDTGFQTEHPSEPFKDSLGTYRFPYCGLRHLYDKLTTTSWTKAFGMDYYTGNGISMHLSIQKAVGATGKVIGDWHCTKVTKWKPLPDGRFEPAEFCKGQRKFSANQECPLCKTRMTYDELGFKNKRHLIGKMDALFQVKKHKYVVGDYKSSSIKAIDNGIRWNNFPYPNNRAQIETYVVLGEIELQEQRNLDVELSEWALIYLARDNPILHKHVVTGVVSAKRKARLKRLYDLYDDQYHQVMFLKQLREARFLIETKPCKDEGDFKEKFGKFGRCPLAENGVCWQMQTLESYLKRAWASRDERWQSFGRPKYLEKL